jgi:hypothetical protein
MRYVATIVALIVATAASAETRKLYGTYGAKLTVTNPELRRSGGGQIGDILFARPGVTGTETAPGAASRPVIRGLDNYRVRIQENGIRVY